MNKINIHGMMKKWADMGLSSQIKKDCDYVNEEGLLVCGVCGELRQKWFNPNESADNNPDDKTRIKIVNACKCDREKQAEEERKKKNQEDMEVIYRLRNLSLMDKKFKDATFDGFKINKYNEKNLKLCKRYATAFDKMLEKNQGLIIWGNVGTGKSFAAACIANYLITQKVSVVMTSLVKVLETIQKSFNSEAEVIEKMNKAKLLIFDDLGAERSTDYALEKVYNIIDSRYRKKLPMILTTNLTVEEMQQETDVRYKRIYDRIFEVCYPIQFTGPSWRQKEAFERFEEMEKLLAED